MMIYEKCNNKKKEKKQRAPGKSVCHCKNLKLFCFFFVWYVCTSICGVPHHSSSPFSSLTWSVGCRGANFFLPSVSRVHALQLHSHSPSSSSLLHHPPPPPRQRAPSATQTKKKAPDTAARVRAPNRRLRLLVVVVHSICCVSVSRRSREFVSVHHTASGLFFF